VGAELVQTVLVDVLDPVLQSVIRPPVHTHGCIHARSTPRHLAALLHAVQLAPAVGLGLAHHVVIVVGLAPGADEVRGAEEGRRAGAELLDLGDVVGKRGGVDEVLVVESAAYELMHLPGSFRTVCTWADGTTWRVWGANGGFVVREVD
jgi:hypothetical protein